MPKQKQTKTLSKIAFDKVCRQLEKSIWSEKASASFVCGGTIPIKPEASSNSGTDKAKNTTVKSSDPVTIYWDAKPDEAEEAHKLVLPGNGSDDIEHSASKLQQLVSACEPAGFGQGQKTVMDTEYRSAGKLEPRRFATTFHPADFGIIDSIEQILVPQLNLMNEELLAVRRVELELYKLNIYSGPSGIFKKHVDTPRSKSQIGSLVVCLPSQFEGGNLVVRHNENEADFDWQRQSAEAIQWAAFYSDCEHEIKTINRGHRITLTYNLYVVEPVSKKFSPISLLDPTSSPLYADLKLILSTPGFLKQGGNLGIFCSHSYPHTAADASELLPHGLKGVDLLLYAALHSFGLKVEVLPVIVRDDDCDDYGDRGGDSDGSSDSDEYYQYKHIGERVYVGAELWGETSTDNFEEESVNNVIEHNWPQRKFKKPVTWISSPRHKKNAITYLAYGNEASIDQIYSSAAIIATIPPWVRRQIPFRNTETQ